MTIHRRVDAPVSVRSLRDRIKKQASGRSNLMRQLELLVADTAIGQMLPPGVIKGGAALQIRYGVNGARTTTDLDATRSCGLDLNNWLTAFEERLASGWGGFKGTLSKRESRTPEGVPDEYVMRKFQIAIEYMGREWTTVTLELTHDEVGSTAEPEIGIGQRVLELYAALGLPAPGPIPLLPAHHQIAQKLHACTDGPNERAHDLVDLQIVLRENPNLDLVQVKETATRLFTSRKKQAWPPTVVAYEKWDTIYADSSNDLGVLPTAGEAIAWANKLVADIDAAAP